MKKHRGRGFLSTKFLGIFLSILLILSAVSCKSTSESAFAFREIAFCAEIEWNVGEEKFCARIQNKPSQKLQISALGNAIVGESGERFGVYVHPLELSGIKVEITNRGEHIISLDNLKLLSNGENELGKILDLIFNSAEAEYSGQKNVNGTSCSVYKASHNSNSDTFFLINSKTKFPLRIVCGNTQVDFVWIETVG